MSDNHHDDRWKAAHFEGPDRIPVGAYFLPATWMQYRQELDALVARHPILFGPQNAAGRDYDAVGGRYAQGRHVDEWGCVWDNVRQGCDAIVTGHPVPTRESVHTLKPPPPGGGLPHGFMWLRLADLRGFEEIMMDFAEEPPELQQLIDIVRDYNVQEMRRIVEGCQDWMVYVGDDLGMQQALAIRPDEWRKYLKPCYQAIYAIPHAAEKSVYMHTDGHILPIIPDLIECGVNVVNPQFRANSLNGLVAACKGRVCVDLDLDRQMFPFCSPSEVDDHVRECVEKLGSPNGGLWLKAECGPDMPLENIEAVCTALEKYGGYLA